MNAQRRKAIEKLCERYNEIDNLFIECKQKAEGLKEEFESIQDEEQEYLDNMPESLQSSDKYSIAENSLEEMGNLITALEEIVNHEEMPSSNSLLEVI